MGWEAVKDLTDHTDDGGLVPSVEVLGQRLANESRGEIINIHHVSRLLVSAPRLRGCGRGCGCAISRAFAAVRCARGAWATTRSWTCTRWWTRSSP